MAVRVHRVRELDDGSVELSIHGQAVDGQYVAGCLNSAKGAQVGEPELRSGTEGIFIYLTARGTEANPLTRRRVVEMLQADPGIELVNVE